VHPRRPLPALRADAVVSATAGLDAHPAAIKPGRFHDHLGQVRQQPLQAEFMLA